MYEFYGWGKVSDSVFATSIRGKLVYITTSDIGRIFRIPSEGWDHYVHHKWPPLNNLPSTLEISQIFFGSPNLAQHKYVACKEMSSLHKLYFDVVHKVIILRKERQSEASYLDLTLIELLDKNVPINLPSLILKHM